MQAPDINPIAVSLGPLKIHWYGIMYLVGFLGAWWLGQYRARRSAAAWNPDEISDLIFYCALGVILGGRLGHVVFYDPAHYIRVPWEILYVWTGGMSFHGGLIGVLVAIWLYARRTQRTFLVVSDFVAPLVPIGLGAGRIGNFINQELWGAVTTSSWGMVFRTGGPLPRHPTQLYEAALEGAALFAMIWLFSRAPRPAGAVSGLFLVGYAVFRIPVEFLRVPEAPLGYLAFGWLTMGQLLSVPMILTGGALIAYAYRNNRV